MKQSHSEINYRALFDNTLDGVIYCQMIFDGKNHPVDFAYLEVNSNFESLLGIKKITGKKAEEVTPGIRQFNPELLEVFGRIALIGVPERFEVNFERLAKWFSVSVYCPKQGYFIAVFQTITDQKLVEKKFEDAKIAARNVFADLNNEKNKLDAAKAKDEALLESMGEGLIAVDNFKKIMVINKVAAAMLGWEMQELVGKLITDLPLEDEAGNLIPLNKRPTVITLITGDAMKATYFFVKKDKTRFPIAITATPINLKGEIIGLIEVIRDVTLEKEIDRAKSEFVSLASHQLRTPTTAVNWFAKMLLNEEVGTLNKIQKNYLENIYNSNKRMIGLIGDLLNVSHIELGSFPIRVEKVNLQTVSEIILKELNPQIEAKKIKVSKEYQSGLPELNADYKLIYIILQNLLSNAVVYTPVGGTVMLRIGLDNKVASQAFLITVADTGIGIPEAQKNKIFGKMFRADNAIEMSADGTGLGLYIVKSILDQTGGTVWFSSGGELSKNLGTSFYITLPLEGMKQRKGDKNLK